MRENIVADARGARRSVSARHAACRARKARVGRHKWEPQAQHDWRRLEASASDELRTFGVATDFDLGVQK